MPMFPVNITKISKIRHRNGRYIDVHISIRIEALIKSTGYRHPFQQQWTKNEKSVCGDYEFVFLTILSKL